MYIGTSAGALNLSAYISREEGFAHDFITQYTTQHEFFNLFQYVKNRQYMDVDWAFERAGINAVEDGYLANAKQQLKHRFAYVCATNSRTLEPHYFSMFEDNWLQILKASCAVPLLFPSSIKIGEEHYVDGAVSAAIPVREAFNRGADIIVVLRTEPVLNSQPYMMFERLEQRFPAQISRFKLEAKFDQFSEFQRQLLKRLQEFRLRYGPDVEPFIERCKQMFPEHLHLNGGRWFLGGEFIYRLQSLSENKLTADMVDMLSKHYYTYQNSIEFLNQPPSRIELIQISPSDALLSNSLLSKPQDLEHDYQAGVNAGKIFLSQYADLFNEISTVPSSN